MARYRLAQFERACLVELTPAELPMATDGVKILLSEARSDVEKAIELSPRFAMAYYNKGNMLLDARDYNGALEAYNLAIAFKHDMGEAYYNRGYVHYRLGNKDAGSADLSKAGELGILPSYNLLKRMN